MNFQLLLSRERSHTATFWFLYRITVIALVACSLSGAESTDGIETDRHALLEFKGNIIDPLGILNSWNSSQHACQWFGVTCGRRHRRITRLNLQSQQLSGTISPHIGNLSFLMTLLLQNNSFHSIIPLEIGRLSRLQYVYLNNNSLTGPIPPSLMHCSNLISLVLDYNMLIGKLPANFGSLTNLWKLILRNNYLFGEIQLSFGNLPSLEYVDLTLNGFEGRIPDTLGNLKNLKILALGGNGLTGNLPSSLTNISSLEALDLADNKLEGVLPSDLGFTLPNVQAFSVSGNRFSGALPISIANMSQLSQFFIASNDVVGDVPSFGNMISLYSFNIAENYLGSGKANDVNFLCSLTNSTELHYLNIGGNNFGGLIPDCIGNLSSTVAAVVMQKNALSGTFPSSMGNLVNLEVLGLSTNAFSGPIPPEIGNLKKLKILYLAFGGFTGEIPHTFGNLSMLTELVLRGNNHVGTMPSSLGNCQSLIFLDLANNMLTGAVPPEIMSLASLSLYLDLSQNNLSGKLPEEIGNLKNLGSLRLHENKFIGEIPSSLGECISLETLYMDENMFTGSLPSSLSSLKGIRELHLSHNRLSGQVPDFLEGLNLTSLDLSYNDFEGELPTGGVFANSSATSVQGNEKLCGGLPEYHLPKCKNFGRSSTHDRERHKLVICMVSGIFAAILVLSLLYVLWQRKQRKTIGPSNSNDGFLRVSYQDLLKATAGFSSANLIGTGSFGSVFKGVLGLEQTPIAVKVLNCSHHGATRSFAAECEALRNISHRNLVKVLTACSGIDYKGNDFKALVYEFMANGSLKEWLHPQISTHSEQSCSPRQLSFVHRVNIAADVACALDYLHHQCETPIVHCDLNPGNILIDDEMTGHVGDFGLVRFMAEANRGSVTDQRSSLGVRGSLGYIAPEYGAGGEVSTSGDVYSFGILVLEMLTGKKPTDDMFIDGLSLHSYSEAALPERVLVLEIIDPVMLQEIQDRDDGQDIAVKTDSIQSGSVWW